MSEELRILLYFLGLIPQLLFGSRFLLQWVLAEWHQKSLVTKLFWQLSLMGNVLMTLHGIIQLHYPLSLAQACNAVIAWRNLDLLGRRRYSAFTALVSLLLAILFVTGVFLWQAPEGLAAWFRAPQLPGGKGATPLTWQWHLWGSLGIILFSSRFWVQWWQAERRQESYLSASFWWISFFGNGMLFVYFWNLNDPVNWLGPLFMIIPSMRNLFFIAKPRGESRSV